ncbi:cytidylyltransferase [Emiliania huxleyi CCMP1516]|uniref:ethanolamine-phosphate cytidylyltransferase n=2 Tax=Emiliania huxleyi TaxID=2903 RepID=A0A0D3KUY4_EMIH1|nr:cytidylyltransferase [Emiliania huxleyi CCMP1516]EOD39569.1 cytidylyltransferase [Emiliania huxleyi CCMP1516]|eukprot:XP_005791998.1 cytidylyltransferase [Emiliania huxleyi CCMP1516]
MSDSRRELLLSAALAASVALLLDRWLRRRGRGTGKDALARELARLEARAEAVREALAGLDEPPQREVRIWMDGAFDMMHYGHANAFRKGRALGTHLIVGVNDDERARAKASTAKACKFVDEVVPKACKFVDEVVPKAIETYRIDYVVHGDDPCIVDGRDASTPRARPGQARALGKYRTIPRTEGVSTTEIVGRGLAETVERRRMLLLTRDHHRAAAPSPVGPAAGGRAREARTAGEGGEGDFLLVGVHSDAVVNRHRGCNFPLLNQQERVLSVLACRHTGDVVIDSSRGRIHANHDRIATKVEKKMVAEQQYYKERYRL